MKMMTLRPMSLGEVVVVEEGWTLLQLTRGCSASGWPQPSSDHLPLGLLMRKPRLRLGLNCQMSPSSLEEALMLGSRSAYLCSLSQSYLSVQTVKLLIFNMGCVAGQNCVWAAELRNGIVLSIPAPLEFCLHGAFSRLGVQCHG